MPTGAPDNLDHLVKSRKSESQPQDNQIKTAQRHIILCTTENYGTFCESINLDNHEIFSYAGFKWHAHVRANPSDYCTLGASSSGAGGSSSTPGIENF